MMSEFINYAFYGKVPEGLSLRAIYELYKGYCNLNNIEPMEKFEFYEEFKPYIN